MDNTTLIAAFVDGVVTHRTRYLVNSDLKVATAADHWQLTAPSEGLIAVSMLTHRHPRVAVRYRSSHWHDLHAALLQVRYLPTGKSQRAGFYEYQQIDVPPGYQVQFTDSLDIMQAWWADQASETPASLISMLALHRSTWHPVRDITCDQGTLLIHTLGHMIKLLPLERLAWLQRRNLPVRPRPITQQREGAIALPPIHTHATHGERPTLSTSPRRTQAPQAAGRTQPDRSQTAPRKMGSYLVEAALLTSAQVEVALRDQRSTGLKFGEILVQRGWLKQKTIEFLMEKVILPQRAAARAAKPRIPPAPKHRPPSPLSPQPRRHSEPQRSLDSSPGSIHSRDTLITDALPPKMDPTLEETLPAASTGVSAIHDRATLITDPIDPNTIATNDINTNSINTNGIHTNAINTNAMDMPPGLDAPPPIDPSLSIHSRATLITDPITDTLAPIDQDSPDRLSVHSRDTLITDNGLSEP